MKTNLFNLSLSAILLVLLSISGYAQSQTSTVKKDIDFSLMFDSQILDGKQEKQFAVMVSSNFNGVYDLENIHMATWTEISDRFRLANHSDNRLLVPSGEAGITDLIVKGKPLYIAFRYITNPQKVQGLYNLWRVQNLLLQSVDKTAEKKPVMAQPAGGWKLIQSSNYEPKRGYIYPNNITFTGNAPAPSKKDEQTEAWAISKAIKLELHPNVK